MLADYGYLTIRISDDWTGADFIAQHVSNGRVLNVQLKGRLTLARKYPRRDLHICFPESRGAWYLYPHDAVLRKLLASGRLKGTRWWDERGLFHFPSLSAKLKCMLEPYRVSACD